MILTDQLRAPTAYESDALAEYRRENCPAQQRLRDTGVSFDRHYPMSAACAPSRASLLTGHYPALHGVTQTDGVAKDAGGDEMFWLAPDTVPTLGDWFRAGGYRTYYKGKWHVSHSHLDADLLDDYGFSEWVGPEPHGLGKRNTGTVKDPFTADETIALLKRLGDGDADGPWLTVCSFLNPHDIALFGIVGLAQGLRYHPSKVPHIPQAPTRHEDLSTKPSCQQSMVDTWGRTLAPQPWIEAHLKFYYQVQATVDEQISRVLDAVDATGDADNTIVVFTSDHGDMQGAHGGIHQKWHNAYEEALRVPFVVLSPLLTGGARTIDVPTSHADLVPTLLGLAGIDHDAALERLRVDHEDARPLVGRDLSGALLDPRHVTDSEPILFTTDDEISEGHGTPASPIQRLARLARMYSTVAQPNHLETVVADVDVDGEPHRVKFTRYHDNAQFWTVPGERDGRLRGPRSVSVVAPEPDEFELYDLSIDPLEVRNLAYPSNATAASPALQATMTTILRDQLEAKRLTPTSGTLPGYRPPMPS